MTTLTPVQRHAARRAVDAEAEAEADVEVVPESEVGVVATRRPVTARMLLWTLAWVLTLVLVLYDVEPLFQQRAQHDLFDQFKVELTNASNQAQSFSGIVAPTKAVEPGQPVGLIEIGRIQLQQVVVEGATPAATAAGPGHVAGTAGLGQPGNSVVVGRRTAFGGPFSELHDLRVGDGILVTTTQGQVVYAVTSVRSQTITTPDPSAAAAGRGGTASSADEGEVVDPFAGAEVPIDVLYGASPDDRLTLVTSAVANPLNSSDATVVTARMVGRPFPPTPQNGRLDSTSGLRAEPGALPGLLLVAGLYAATLLAAVVLYRRVTGRVAYLLSAAPIVAVTILLAEALSRLLAAWA